MAEAEARTWRLLQAVPDPLVVTGAGGVIEMINAPAVLLFGYEPEELIGQPVETLLPAGLHDEHRRHRANYLAVDEPRPMATGMNIVAARKDGSTVAVEVQLSAITLSGGRSVLASIRDVSDRTRMEAERKINDELLRASFDWAPTGMAMIDLRPASVGQLLRVNQALCTMTGYSPAELLATGSAAITHPDDRAQTTANLQRLADGGDSRWVTDKRYQTKSGQEIWVHFAVSVVHDSAGGPAYGVSQVEDITHRKIAEAQLQSQFHALTENVDAGFLVRQLDPPEFVYYNPAYVRIFGYDPAGPPPTPAQAMASVYAEDLDRVGTVLSDVAQGRQVDLEWRFTRLDGQLRWASGRVAPIFDRDGQIRRVAGVFTDITDRRAAEEAARAAHAEAERANAAKTEFLSRMSHELRTPLHAILGFGQLLELDVLSDDHRVGVRHILAAGERLLRLVDDILDISRRQTRTIPLSLVPVHVGAVVRHAVAVVAPLADLRRIRVETDSSGFGAFVFADRQRLMEVLVNLLTNAVKYNKECGTVRVEAERTAAGRLRLTVSDTGAGIPERDLGRLFQPFERLAADESVVGTGLGLALTKLLITEMGGQVGVHSQPGVGSSFWFELRTSAPPADGERQAPAPAIDPPPISGGPRTVLYIEDNLSNVRLLKQILDRRPQITMLIAMQGRVGVEMALTHPLDLILLDLNLPDIPGEEVLRCLRADARTAGTPIVILSADATADQPERLMALGATSYLTKPVKVPHILDLVDRLGRDAAESTTLA